MSEPNKLNLILTRPALDRLLGDNQEVTVEIKHAAAKEILDKHIAGKISSQMVQDVETRLKKGLADAIEKELGKFSGRYSLPTYEPSAQVKLAIQNKVGDVVSETVKVFVDEQTSNIEAKIQNEVDSVVRRYIRIAVDRELKAVQEKLDAQIQSHPLFKLGKLGG